MKKVQPEEGKSADIVSENIERLKELFPDAFSEGGVDFEVFRQLLGDAKVLDEGEEKYGLVWHGKKKARQIALTPSTGTLLPCPEESVDWDTTKNLFIEGDNLEVLKLLQKSYANKVKMIYIDPPYNTGKEFIYPDNFHDNLDTYLKYTGQVDDKGMKFSSNTESSGRKHTNWLNMMCPRLKLARSLLKEDGVIFLSIDDGEQANLRKICDEVFGEDNFVGNIIWQKKYAASNDAKYLSDVHDFILCYCKNKEQWKPNLFPRSSELNDKYKNPDNDPRGVWYSTNLSVKTYSTKNDYVITSPEGIDFRPPASRAWVVSKEKYEELLADNRIWFGKDGLSRPYQKKFLSEVQQGIVPTTLWLHEEAGHNIGAKSQVRDLFSDTTALFDTPKPTKLIDRLITLSTNSDENNIILDFFSGSCATAHAVMAKNIEDQRQDRFIMVQLPEANSEDSEAYLAGYKTIADMSRERIRRAANLLFSENTTVNYDLGFKAFILTSSNIQAWNPDRSDLEESLLSHEEHIVQGRSELDILYELLLKRGVDLTVPIENREVAGKTVYSIGYGVLFACLDESIKKEQVEEIGQAIVKWHQELAPSSDTHVFFRDSAFSDDVSKTNMAAILEQNGITHVRSL